MTKETIFLLETEELSKVVRGAGVGFFSGLVCPPLLSLLRSESSEHSVDDVQSLDPPVFLDSSLLLMILLFCDQF